MKKDKKKKLSANEWCSCVEEAVGVFSRAPIMKDVRDFSDGCRERESRGWGEGFGEEVGKWGAEKLLLPVWSNLY